MTSPIDLGDLDADVNGLHFLGEERFTGEAVEASPAGTVVSSTFFVDGVEEGPHRLWHPNGRLEFSCELHDGNPVGIARTWREDGSLEEEQQFDDEGALVGVRRWDPAGAALPDPVDRGA